MNDLLTVEDTLLDEMFALEAGCESAHVHPDNLRCSGPVTHRSTTTCGARPLNVCAAYVAWFTDLVALHQHSPCSRCWVPIADDWQVLPA